MYLYTMAQDMFVDAVYNDPSKRRLIANVTSKIRNPIVSGYEQYGYGTFSEYIPRYAPYLGWASAVR
jgi:hypothetical protein